MKIKTTEKYNVLLLFIIRKYAQENLNYSYFASHDLMNLFYQFLLTVRVEGQVVEEEAQRG